MELHDRVQLEPSQVSEQIKQFLLLAKRKPYMSYWGELFHILYTMRRMGQRDRRDIDLYNLAAGKVIFDWRRDRFLALLPDMTITLTDQELVDALLRGILVPL